MTNHSLFFRLISDIYKTWYLIILSVLISIMVMMIVNLILQNEKMVKVFMISKVGNHMGDNMEHFPNDQFVRFIVLHLI